MRRASRRFRTWARDLYVYRQRAFLKDDPMFLNCLPPGGPRQFQNRFGLQVLEDRDRQRVFVMMGGGNRNWRLIYTDGREQKGQITGDADNPLYFGRAVGKWEGDALVVDTKGFNERFWFSNGGLPHTEQLHLVERVCASRFRHVALRCDHRRSGRLHAALVRRLDAALDARRGHAGILLPGQSTMRTRFLIVRTRRACGAAGGAGGAGDAHHSFAAEFDGNKPSP